MITCVYKRFFDWPREIHFCSTRVGDEVVASVEGINQIS